MWTMLKHRRVLRVPIKAGCEPLIRWFCFGSLCRKSGEVASSVVLKQILHGSSNREVFFGSLSARQDSDSGTYFCDSWFHAMPSVARLGFELFRQDRVRVRVRVLFQKGRCPLMKSMDFMALRP